jgi:serine/threonine protein kinase
MRMEERWKRGRNLGTGSFGTVWLEKLIVENGEKYRAVKEVRKVVQRSKAIDYSRELEAIAKFSHQKVQKGSFFGTFLLFSVPSLLLAHQLSEAYRGKYSMKCAL